MNTSVTMVTGTEGHFTALSFSSAPFLLHPRGLYEPAFFSEVRGLTRPLVFSHHTGWPLLCQDLSHLVYRVTLEWLGAVSPSFPRPGLSHSLSAPYRDSSPLEGDTAVRSLRRLRMQSWPLGSSDLTSPLLTWSSASLMLSWRLVQG